ncbi:glycosyltransferase family 39 protein [Candidatus Woesearchaeota archaeon]|nr:glycosyltransferase family 39 protein [Candidatus Woesearchaeota archaeon]
MKLISRLKTISKYEKYALITIVIAIILRFALTSVYAVSGDACWHLSAARFMAENLEIPLFDGVGRDEPFWPPPLFHFIAAAFYLVFGETGLKLVSPLFGSLTLIVAYFLFRKMLDEKQSFYAIFFLSFIPLYIDYNVLGYVESVLTFLFAAGIYLALEKRFFLAGAATGLAMLTKNNGIFLIPVLAYIAWKKSGKNGLLKNLFFVAIMPGIIASPWLLRNWLSMGNPIWPFMNNIFHGMEMHSYLDFAAENIISKGTYLALYLGFFGVPDGNYNALFFANLPNFALLLGIYIMATIIFLIPLFFGLGKGKSRMIWYVLLASFVPLFFLYVSNVGAFVSRMLMPSFLALAFFYGIGMGRIAGKPAGKIFFILLIIISAGFIGTEAFKFRLARQSWDFYQQDFEWVKANTQESDLIMAGGQCMSFYLGRLQVWPKQENIGKARYAFVNQDFAVDRLRAKTPEGVLGSIRKKSLVYRNQDSKTEIYSLRD